MKSLDEILQILKDEGFRLTGTRKKLIKKILSLKGHWNIQDVANELKKSVTGIGVATIYRTIHLLAEKGILLETKVGADAARYEVAPTHHHDHLTCNDCGTIFEFENDQIENLQKQIAHKLGFELADHRMELYGSCQKKPSCPHLSASRARS